MCQKPFREKKSFAGKLRNRAVKEIKIQVAIKKKISNYFSLITVLKYYQKSFRNATLIFRKNREK